MDLGHSINGNDVVTLGLLELPFSIGDRNFTVNARIMRGLVRMRYSQKNFETISILHLGNFFAKYTEFCLSAYFM